MSNEELKDKITQLFIQADKEEWGVDVVLADTRELYQVVDVTIPQDRTNIRLIAIPIRQESENAA